MSSNHNPVKECEHDDPMELTGIVVPADAEADLEMMHAFIDEYLWQGFSPAKILALFQNPFYLAGYRVHQEKGEAAVVAMIEKRFKMWGGVR